MIKYDGTVRQYVDEFMKQYANNDDAYVVAPGDKRIRCYAILIQRGAKNVVLKKGSVIRTIEDFKNTQSILYRLKRRIEIQSDTLLTTDGYFEVVTADFICTSKTEAVALSALVSTVSSYCYKLKKDNKIVIADKSKETDSLSESARQEALSIAEEIYNNKKQEEIGEQERKLKDLTYNYIEVDNFTDTPLSYNNDRAEYGLYLLETNYTLYVTGMSRSGKTFLCKYIAGKYSGKDTSKLTQETVCLDNVLWINSCISKDEFIALFARFCVHNENATRPLLVMNEAEKMLFMKLFPFWEYMDSDGKTFKDFVSDGLSFEYNGMTIEVPKNLRIMANIANEQYDIQMENRFGKRLDLDAISLENKTDIANYTGIPESIIEILIKFQNKLEDEWGENKRFIVPYKLKNNPVQELNSYISTSIRKVIGRDFEELKQTLIEYIDTL